MNEDLSNINFNGSHRFVRVLGIPLTQSDFEWKSKWADENEKVFATLWLLTKHSGACVRRWQHASGRWEHRKPWKLQLVLVLQLAKGKRHTKPGLGLPEVAEHLEQVDRPCRKRILSVGCRAPNCHRKILGNWPLTKPDTHVREVSWNLAIVSYLVWFLTMPAALSRCLLPLLVVYRRRSMIDSLNSSIAFADRQ
jgi:hypothetical protein